MREQRLRMDHGTDKKVVHPTAWDTLERLLATGRVHHALHFSGPEGFRKEDTARALTNTLLCHTPVEGSACGNCRSCHLIQAGTHPDMLVIPKGEPRVKIAEVRGLEDFLRLKPVESHGRCAVVLDADRLTLQAQNALLKTLEEPRPQTYLILTSRQAGKLLGTVLSRVQTIPFGPLPAQALADDLEKQLGATPKEALFLARLSGGSATRASALDLETLRASRQTLLALDQTLNRGVTPGVALSESQKLPTERQALSEALDLLLTWTRDQATLAAGAKAEVVNVDMEDALHSIISNRSLHSVLERGRAITDAQDKLASPFNLNPQMIAEELCLALTEL